MNTKTEKLFKNIFLATGLLSVCGAFIYRFYMLNIFGIVTALVVSILFCIFYILATKKYINKNNQEITPPDEAKSKISFVYSLSYLLLVALSLLILMKSRTADAIISPWQTVPKYFFVFYFIAILMLVINIVKRNKLSLFLIILHYTITFVMAIIVYKIGYGFDSFIHQATEKLIAQNGVVEPKPFYYLGQYALVVIINKITFLNLVWIDKLLVPILAGLAMPLALYQTLRRWFDNEVKINLTILFLLILPFTIFIVTTPQNLAYLFLLLTILYGLKCSNWLDLSAVYLFSLVALVTQPIAGIPAVLFSIVLTIYCSDLKKFKPYLYGLLFLIIIVSLPTAFYFLGKNQMAAANLSADTGAAEVVQQNSNFNLSSIPSALTLKNPAQENFILNFIYLYAFNLKFIIALLTIISLIIAIKYLQKYRILFIYAGISVSLLISFLLTKTLPFNFLIAYERNNYTDRILVIAVLFLLPLMLVAIYGIISQVEKQNKFFKIAFLTFACLLATVSLYVSYPRNDKYFNSRGFSTGKNDIEAVRWINDNAKSGYIVLANQQVSAAALREFGFNKYYKNDIFYYPIPTGGPLYQFYLDMVYKKPARKTMEQAMDLTGVNESYFVLNKYWWAFPKILEEAKLEADSWMEIGNGEIYVFKYSLASQGLGT